MDDTSLLSKLNLDHITKTIKQPYHQTGAGRPPRKPLGIFKALMIKQLRHIPSDRKLYRETQKHAVHVFNHIVLWV